MRQSKNAQNRRRGIVGKGDLNGVSNDNQGAPETETSDRISLQGFVYFPNVTRSEDKDRIKTLIFFITLSKR